ncbi:host specificity factor TipJ family phage tail protein [Breoghania sp.]|uniref:host specificity factor TipJ family phage tail protein n=1 Tax=Breoghania sp. TaxID=2065378 RepID=UPI002AAB84A3|nr:host specificity factor TipJ family phage tail protein [Breoghania sp.]
MTHHPWPLLSPVALPPADAGTPLAAHIARHGPPAALPFVVSVDGQAVLRKDWQMPVADTAVIEAVVLPAGGGGGKQILGFVAMIALAVFAPWAGGFLAGALSLGATAAGAIGTAILIGGGILIQTLIGAPPVAGRAGNLEASPTYSTSASGNAARLYEPIPVQYGRMRMVPDYAADPYQEFEGNDQYLYMLLSRGMGRYEAEAVYIGETVVWTAADGFTGSIDDIELTFHDPDEEVTAFPVQVETSSDVASLLLEELIWIGPYAAVPSGQQAHRLAVDLFFPEGLYAFNDKGDRQSVSVSWNIEYREIDDSGVAVGSWETLSAETLSMKTATPQRISRSLDVPLGRYEVRAQRVNPWSSGDKKLDRLEWGGLRAYLDGPQSFPCSTLAVKVRANEQLSAQSSQRISVIQTRILPVWDGEQWSEAPTRSIAWAAVDICRNAIYGAALPDARIDLAAFLSYDAVWAARGDRFDGVFDTRQTRFDAMQAVLAAGRASVSFSGNVISMVRDEPRALARQVFTDRNIVRNSLSIDYEMHRSDTADDVIVEYIDEETWQPAEVRCTLAASNSVAPVRKKLFGVCQRDQAWAEGIYSAADNYYRRVFVSFETEWEGRLLRRGDSAIVQCEMPQTWGASGILRGRNGLDLTLSAEPDTDPANTYIMLRTKRGGEWGPVKLTGWTGTVVTLDAADLAYVEGQHGPLDDQIVDTGEEAPTYLIGEGVSFARRVIILMMQPEGDRVSISAVVDNPAVYVADQGVSVPDRPTTGVLPPSTGIPHITGVYVRREQSVAESRVHVSAAVSGPAVSFKAEVSYDLSAWEPIYAGALPTFSAPVLFDALWIRMAAVGKTQGAWSDPVAVAAGTPELRLPDGTSVTATDLYGQAKEALERAERLAADVASRADEIAQAALAKAFADRAVIGTIEQRVSAVLAELGSAQAAIVEEQTARVDGDTATASALTAVSASIDGLTTELQTYAESIAGLSTSYVLRGSVDGGSYGGFAFTGAQAPDGSGPEYTFAIRADKFLVLPPEGEAGDAVPPIVFEGGTAYFSNLISQSITADDITTGSMVGGRGLMEINLDAPFILMSAAVAP